MLGVRLYAISHEGGRLRRYWRCALETIRHIRLERPQFVFAQNPSILLNYLLLVLRVFFRFRFITDAHYGGVIAHTGSATLQSALDFCNRSADLVIVTNENHANHVERIGGTPIVCPDPLPDLAQHRPVESRTICKSVFFICSYEADEPFEAVFQAAELLSQDGFRVFASGNFKRVGIQPEQYPHVELMGFVSEEKFYQQLYASELVIDLTENEDCLVCGAYEAMVAEKPLVTSRTEALRKFFDSGTVFSGHDSASIAEAVRNAYDHRNKLVAEIREWKLRARDLEQQRRSALMAAIGMD